jgi:hypothetical protein
MAKRRAMNGILHNFVGTFSSRYSDWDGYWLFGVLFVNPEPLGVRTLTIDLLSHHLSGDPDPVEVARRLAALRFGQQLVRAQFPRSDVREATLTVAREATMIPGKVNGYECMGWRVDFVSVAVLQSDVCYRFQRDLFFAPHNPQVEMRSTRT